MRWWTAGPLAWSSGWPPPAPRHGPSGIASTAGPPGTPSARILLLEHKTQDQGAKAILLTPHLRVVFAGLKSLGILGNPHVFPGSGKDGTIGSSIDHAWRAVRVAARCPGVRLHDLRHTYASFAAGLGLSLPQIGALLGHSAPSTTQRYSHLAPTTLQDAAERIGAVVGEALG